MKLMNHHFNRLWKTVCIILVAVVGVMIVCVTISLAHRAICNKSSDYKHNYSWSISKKPILQSEEVENNNQVERVVWKSFRTKNENCIINEWLRDTFGVCGVNQKAIAVLYPPPIIFYRPLRPFCWAKKNCCTVIPLFLHHFPITHLRAWLRWSLYQRISLLNWDIFKIV